MNYPFGIKLTNGNIFTLTSSGIYLLSSTLVSIKTYYVFQNSEEKANNEKKYDTVDIAKFPDKEGGYIATIFKKQLYLCNEKRLKYKNDLTSEINTNNPSSVVAYK